MPIQTAAQQSTMFRNGDFVLYRDPVRFWRGEPNHTFVCRIDNVLDYTSGQTRYRLTPLTGERGAIREVCGEYMRLLPPVDAMRDIDTAPLNTDLVADDMTPAAVAWLTQQHATANRAPQLPAHD
ncbi:hypothetical protein QFZ75_000055 [Streptomyces sp. V3I8]|uniref:hypothetical protein n=1 Tax=Streptomyces sp. V3I8 TaxID=3042279 RepID=UPI0027842B82|nr:hypothetical protein [Streptomyces sp. V3I8]MDQ1033639.1 hypothetical protein [Streptomyces sp. V3I8]